MINNVYELKIGQEVKYSFYSNITFEGIDDENQVILKDKSGNIKKVYRSLFEKYGCVINENIINDERKNFI